MLTEQEQEQLAAHAASSVYKIASYDELMREFVDFVESLDRTDPFYWKPTNGKCTIPVGVDTVSGWKRKGRKIKPDAVPFGKARVARAFGGLSVVCDVFRMVDTVPIKAKQQRASDAAPLQKL